jgi:hypothetical protein
VLRGGGSEDEAGRAGDRCPACGSQHWQRVAELPRAAVGGEEHAPSGVAGPDTS